MPQIQSQKKRVNWKQPYMSFSVPILPKLRRNNNVGRRITEWKI